MSTARCAWLAGWLAMLVPESSWALVDWEGEKLELDLSGSAKFFTIFTRTYSTNVTPSEISAAEATSFRINFTTKYADWLTFEGAYQLFPTISGATGLGVISQSNLFGGLIQPVMSPLRIADLNRGLAIGEGWQVNQNLDRAVLTVEMDDLEIRLGRQAIGHGSARVFNATDIFSPFSLATLDNEYKQGLDAVRATFTLGETSEVELYAIGHDDALDHGVYLLRFRKSFPGVDISAYAGSSYLAPTFALDVSGDLWGATLYGEALYRYWNRDAWEDSTERNNVDSARIPHSARATIGGQYFFEFDLSVIVELHYNGIGRLDPDEYALVVGTPEWQNGEIFLLGRFYSGVTLSYQITDLVSTQVAWIFNFADQSSLVTPGLSWDFGENTTVNLGAILGAGRRPEVSLAGLDFNSELGLYPYTFYLDVRLFL